MWCLFDRQFMHKLKGMTIHVDRMDDQVSNKVSQILYIVVYNKPKQFDIANKSFKRVIKLSTNGWSVLGQQVSRFKKMLLFFFISFYLRIRSLSLSPLRFY